MQIFSSANGTHLMRSLLSLLLLFRMFAWSLYLFACFVLFLGRGDSSVLFGSRVRQVLVPKAEAVAKTLLNWFIFSKGGCKKPTAVRNPFVAYPTKTVGCRLRQRQVSLAQELLEKLSAEARKRPAPGNPFAAQHAVAERVVHVNLVPGAIGFGSERSEAGGCGWKRKGSNRVWLKPKKRRSSRNERLNPKLQGEMGSKSKPESAPPKRGWARKPDGEMGINSLNCLCE